MPAVSFEAQRLKPDVHGPHKTFNFPWNVRAAKDGTVCMGLSTVDLTTFFLIL